MTLSITMAEPGAKDTGTQEKGFGPQEKHSQSGALSFACTKSVVIVVASKCQPFLKPTSDHPEFPLGPCLLRVMKAGYSALPITVKPGIGP